MIPSWAGRYVGIPFVSGGRGLEGCDCYGLVRLVLLLQFGYRLPLLSGEYRDALDSAVIEPVVHAQIPLLTGEKIETPEAGAVGVMKTRGAPSHIGIFVDAQYILHTLNRIGSHCVRFDCGPLRGSLEGIYRVDKSYRITTPV
ncbi:MAG: C40 family peptidase [Treponema sp.]|jgi:cell wall-associated NlpC family hydrolase|nr:C40 family peptidase [Treponema sp.]